MVQNYAYYTTCVMVCYTTLFITSCHMTISGSLPYQVYTRTQAQLTNYRLDTIVEKV